MNIGKHCFDTPLILAPMAGVTDLPFRQLCIKYGASAAISEMISAKPELMRTQKSLKRQDHSDEAGIRWIQIAGSDPELMANAAQYNESLGADIIDINMGCPAKKVCNKAAGSALLQYPDLVADILDAVLESVSIPVTLKIRTGNDPENKNALDIAKIAEKCGISALSVHGRTRSCKFKGEAEFETVSEVKNHVSIPVFANGDIDSAKKAKKVLQQTSADGLLIGRAAQGRPWIFQEIRYYLEHGELPQNGVSNEVGINDIGDIMLQHVEDLHQFYGEKMGLRIARKHVGWYLKQTTINDDYRKQFNHIDEAEDQLLNIKNLFNRQSNNMTWIKAS